VYKVFAFVEIQIRFDFASKLDLKKNPDALFLKSS
jgi:hypothetical protein